MPVVFLPERSSSVVLLVFGQKALRVLNLERDETSMRFLDVTEVALLADWLLDVAWLSWEDTDNYGVLAITAHNVLIKHCMVKGELVSTRYPNEVICILYPGGFVL